MSELTSVIPALFRCPSCNATGIRYEHHDYADEPLGCPDCEGQGIYNVDYAFKIGRLVDKTTIDYEAAWGYARHEDNGWLAARDNDDLVVLDKTDVMAVVDAALGDAG